MGTPSMSTNDAERVSALQKYAILDSEPELAFDDLTLLASYVCKTPIALISLIDEDRQWFKAKVGISATAISFVNAHPAVFFMGSKMNLVDDNFGPRAYF